jgi:hypothetical protein
VSERAAGQLRRPEVWSGVAAGYDDAIAPIMRPYAITTLDLLGPAGGAAGRPEPSGPRSPASSLMHREIKAWSGAGG